MWFRVTVQDQTSKIVVNKWLTPAKFFGGAAVLLSLQSTLWRGLFATRRAQSPAIVGTQR
jgi:hypothetical protein